MSAKTNIRQLIASICLLLLGVGLAAGATFAGSSINTDLKSRAEASDIPAGLTKPVGATATATITETTPTPTESPAPKLTSTLTTTHTSTGTATPTATPTVEICRVLAGNIVPSANVVITGWIPLNDVAAVSGSDVWTVGSVTLPGCCWFGGRYNRTGAIVEHWDGVRWRIVPQLFGASESEPTYLFGVAALAPNDVWAVGGHRVTRYHLYPLIMHWDGIEWRDMLQNLYHGILYDITAISANDVWAVGSMIMHWNGSQWSQVPTPNISAELHGVAAVSANDVWAVGTADNQTRTLHWDGTQWSLVPSPNPHRLGDSLNDVAAVSSNDVWAVGRANGENESLTLHWDGVQWNQVPGPAPANQNITLFAVDAASSNDVWAGGQSYECAQGCSPTTMFRWDGSQWRDAGDPLGGAGVLGLDLIASNDVWATGSGTAHWDGSQWSMAPSVVITQAENTLRGAAALAEDDIWAVGSNFNWGPTVGRYYTLVEHWDGTRWQIVPSPNEDSGSSLSAVEAVSPNDVWAVGGVIEIEGFPPSRALVEHWDGVRWSIVPIPDFSPLADISARAANDAWAVGYYGSFSDYQPMTLHWDGEQFNIVPGPSVGGYLARLSGVKAIAADDVWAVGYYKLTQDTPEQTLTMRWDGAQWNVVPSPNVGTGSNRLSSVSASSAGDVWAVGYYGPVGSERTLTMRWDGSQWSVVSSPNLEGNNQLLGVDAASADNVWAVGNYTSEGAQRTLAMRWDGSQWNVVFTSNPDSNTSALYSVDAISPTEVWGVGNYYSHVGPMTLTERFGPPSFSDVLPDNPFYTYISALACRGIISGYADGTFRWGNSTTRGQLCKIVVLAESWTLYTPPTPTFTDVPAEHPFYAYIETAYSHNTIAGYADGTFRPQNDVTRGQLCKIVVLAEGWTPKCPKTGHFTDVAPDDPFYCLIETAHAHGIISGYADGTFRPGNSATRGQISKIVYLAGE